MGHLTANKDSDKCTIIQDLYYQYIFQPDAENMQSGSWNLDDYSIDDELDTELTGPRSEIVEEKQILTSKGSANKNVPARIWRAILAFLGFSCLFSSPVRTTFSQLTRSMSRKPTMLETVAKNWKTAAGISILGIGSMAAYKLSKNSNKTMTPT